MNQRSIFDISIFKITFIFALSASCLSGEPKAEPIPFTSEPIHFSAGGVQKVFYPRHDFLAENQTNENVSNIQKSDTKSVLLGNKKKGWVIRRLSSKTGATSFTKDQSLPNHLTQVFSYSQDGGALFIFPGKVAVVFQGDRDDVSVQSWIKKYGISEYRRITPFIIVIDSQPGVASVQEAEKIKTYDFVKDAYPDVATEMEAK